MSSAAFTVPHDSTSHLATSRVHFDRILLDFDFKPSSFRALPVAAAYARLFGTKLSILHVAPEPSRHGWEGAADEEIHHLDLESIQAAFRKLSRESSLQGLQYRTLSESGPLPEVTAKVVEREEINLLVMGSRGLPGAGQLVMGSHAETVLRRSTCPVLVVGPVATLPGKISTVMLATGLGTGALRPAQYASAIAQEMQADLMLLHVVGEDRGLPLEARREVATQVKQSLDLLLPDEADRWCTPHLQVEFGDPATAVLRAANELQPDLLVCGVNDTRTVASHLPWTTIAEIIREAPCPVLAVRPHAS